VTGAEETEEVMPTKRPGDGGSGAQKCTHAPLPDAARAKEKSYTPSALERRADRGGAEKNVQTKNTKNLAQGKWDTIFITVVRKLRSIRADAHMESHSFCKAQIRLY
jgi:hypothetical protein